MANTVAGVFGDYSKAQDAVSELLVSGFTRDQIYLSQREGKDLDEITHAESFGGKLQKDAGMDDFFRSLATMFTDYDELTVYSGVVKMGKTVLIVHADSDERVERAAGIINRHSPLDVEEYVEQVAKKQTPGTGLDRAILPESPEQGAEAVSKDVRPRNVGSVRIFPRPSFRSSSDSPRGIKQSFTVDWGGGAHVPDDAEFRRHWQHSYWVSGGSYDDYAPAYRYGADYADNDTNPNHQWADVEEHLRNDWLTYNREDNTWEKNKEAIRYGWEKGKQRAKGTHSGESLRRR